MIEPDGLVVETELPFAWSDGMAGAATLHGSRLLLKVANLLDQHEQEPDKSHERIEAKLDLMLHWLGLQLFGSHETDRQAHLWLSQDAIEWQAEPLPSASAGLTVELWIHPALAAPLRLAARAVAASSGRARAELIFPDEELADAWAQWLFRLHRKAIHEARQSRA